MLRAITFDFWGTLVDAGGQGTKSLRVDRLAYFLPRFSREELDAAYDRAWAHFRELLDQGLGPCPVTMVSLTLDLLGAALLPPEFDALTRYWEESILDEPPALLPGALDVLRAVRGRGLWVGLISDTGVTPGRVTRRFLRDRSALRLFDWLSFSDELGISKACPQAFRQTLRAFGVRPDEAAHLGDLPQSDLRGAKASGVCALLLLENSHREDGIAQADLTLERLADLPNALDHWEEALAHGGVWRPAALGMPGNRSSSSV